MHIVSRQSLGRSLRGRSLRSAAALLGASALGFVGCASEPPPTDVQTSSAITTSPGERSLVWQEANTNAGYYWGVNGTTRVNQGEIPSAPLPWKIAASGDFNNDGFPDLAWRNTATGENALWFMRYGEIAASTFIPPVADQQWTVGGSTDFNGDGNDDLVWRNAQTGQNAIWFLNGSGQTGSTYLQSIPGENWKIEAAADSGIPYPGGGTGVDQRDRRFDEAQVGLAEHGQELCGIGGQRLDQDDLLLATGENDGALQRIENTRLPP